MSQNALAQEYPPAAEAAAIADLAQRLQDKITEQYQTGIMRRDAHPKMHGLVRAEFTVLPDIADEWRVGVFREAKTYQAWIRFSNQNDKIQSDLEKDIRGMAIKLMGVPGDKLLETELNARTHDFIVISTNVFVTRDVAEFDALVKAMTSGFLATAWFFMTHLRVGWNLLRSMKPCGNPLRLRYWSTTPYLFGSNAVKYSAIPVLPDGSVADDCIPINPGPDYLREAMVSQLARGDVHFHFAVQKQLDADSMPIEDPGVEWREQLSPFVNLAAIRIMQQEFDTPAQREFGENLSYNPWHCLPEHRPLGGINRARKVVYETISRFRHQRNQVSSVEPVDWELPTGRGATNAPLP